MTPRDRVEAVLHGERPDRVPFTAYEHLVPRCEAERHLRNDGLCLIARTPPVYRPVYKSVTVERVTYLEDGVFHARTHVHTPAGDLQAVERVEVDGESSWYTERLFTGPDDYRAVECLIRGTEFAPNYEAFEEAQRAMGGDAFMLAEVGYSPLQEIIYTLMGLEVFSVEWSERRDEVMGLYEALTENRRRIYPLVADSPAYAANYGGNVSAEVVGLERFETYYLPHYNEFADVMHDRGKVVGVHFDANTWVLAEAIAASRIDYIEAFTPRPDTDMTIGEARTAWPDKVLWINFPTSVHGQANEAIAETARQILWEAAPGDRFLVGVTEEVPPDRRWESFGTILGVINQEAGLPIRWKSPLLGARAGSSGRA